MPAPYDRIACFIDDDPAADVVLAEARALRAASPGELHVVHVASAPWQLYAGPYGIPVAFDELEDAARSWLDERLAEVPGVIGRVLDGWPPRVACEYAAENRIDLIVGAAHRGVVARAMLGGFAGHVAYHAPCPVLLVHPPPPAEGS